MRTFFVNAPHNIPIKNFLEGDFYRVAMNNPEVRIVVFVPAGRVEELKEKFTHERCVILPEPDLGFARQRAKKLFRLIVLSSIPTESMYIRIYANYKNGGSLLSFLARRIFWYCGHVKLWRTILRFVEYGAFYDDRAWAPFFERYQPDAVFAASMFLEEDVVFLKHARRRRISSLGMVASWDNLTTKVMLMVFPDMLFVPNPTMREEAMRLDDYPKERIRVVGFAQFAHYRDPSWQIAKEEVGREFALDPAKQWVTYWTGGMPTVVLPKEVYTHHLKILKSALDRGVFPNAAVIARPHPTDPLGSGKRIEGVPVLDFGKNFEYNERVMKLLMNLVRHSAVIVNLGSTISLEAAIFDRPVVLAAFNGEHDEAIPRHHRIGYALEHTTHCQYILKSGGVVFTRDEKELISAVHAYLQDPSLDREGRKHVVDALVGPLDGKVADRIVNGLSELCRKKN